MADEVPLHIPGVGWYVRVPTGLDVGARKGEVTYDLRLVSRTMDWTQSEALSQRWADIGLSEARGARWPRRAAGPWRR